MSTRLFAVLFSALFIIGIFPLVFFESLGIADAGVTNGFLLVIDDTYHVAGFCATGVLSILLGREAIMVVPLATILMQTTGALTEMDAGAHPALRLFILGAILLFSFCISLLRKKSRLMYLMPVSAWAFYAGSGFMRTTPLITTPLFFLLGTIVASSLLLAIGVTLGYTMSDRLRSWFGRAKLTGALVTFLALF